MSPHRYTRTPILVYCEGLQDQVLIRYLERLYHKQTSNFYFDIKHGDGGSPKSLVLKAAKMPGAYSERIVIFDNDRGNTELQVALIAAKKLGISLSLFTPCLECILLGILEPKKDFSSLKTTALKKQFHAKYIKANKRHEQREYEKTYTKKLITIARKRIPELDEKIVIFER